MKIYLAGSADCRSHMLVMEAWLLDRLADRPLSFTSVWYHLPPIEDADDRARLDFDGIDGSDLVIAVYPWGPGTTSEMGYAIGSGKPLIYYEQDCDEMPLVGGLLSTRPSCGLRVTAPLALLHAINQLCPDS